MADEYAFYAPNGDPISKEKFLMLYNQIYRWNCADWELEKEIEAILTGEISSSDDIVKIFKWKTGVRSTVGKTVKYRRTTINADEIYKYVKRADVNKPEALLDDLLNIKGSGIGSTYALTVLYFFSHGKYPIYDSLAHTAVDAVYNRIDFDKKVKSGSISDSKNGTTVLKSYNENYLSKLNAIFEGKEIQNRDVDRALWEYGKLLLKEHR